MEATTKNNKKYAVAYTVSFADGTKEGHYWGDQQLVVNDTNIVRALAQAALFLDKVKKSSIDIDEIEIEDIGICEGLDPSDCSPEVLEIMGAGALC